MNMSYCRFQNTLRDLQDCLDGLVDDGLENLSPEERSACDRLRELCQNFNCEYDEQYYGDDDDYDDE